MGIDYQLAPGPSRPRKRAEIIQHTGQKLYPAIEFEDGTWYREESKDMEKTIRDGKLMLLHQQPVALGRRDRRREQPRFGR